MLSEEFVANAHGGLTCFECHEGTEGVEEKEAAHVGQGSDPSDAGAEENICGACHNSKAQTFEASLHYTQGGYFWTFEQRSGLAGESTPAFMQAFGEHCGQCHATCGQCHISRPASVGGGLVEEHDFMATPDMNAQCTACHGSRVNDEFKGVHPGLRADVHYVAGMDCMDCHTGSEMHGTGFTPDNMREAIGRASCVDCHPGPAAGDDGITHHELHAQAVDCPVCHSQPYRNCYQCHVGESAVAGHGIRFPSELDFRIGKNPIPSTSRPWEYTVVRHIPVYPEMYEAYGITLDQFDTLPTWKYAVPHNIRRDTPQTESCDNCHGERGIFLTAAYQDSLITDTKAVTEEISANAAVVTDPPALPGGSTSRRK